MQDLLQDPRDDFSFHFLNLAQVSHIAWPFSLQCTGDPKEDSNNTKLNTEVFFFEFFKVFEILFVLIDVAF